MKHTHCNIVQCNSFGELETPDDGRIRPKHVVRTKGVAIISCIVDGDIFYEINYIITITII
jgi:hypothetical protein